MPPLSQKTNQAGLIEEIGYQDRLFLPIVEVARLQWMPSLSIGRKDRLVHCASRGDRRNIFH